MFPKLINLTLMLVIQEIEDILKEYPEHPYQVAFSNQELRQQLILRLLSQIPNYYALVEDAREVPEDPRCLYGSSEEKTIMEILIRQSIAHLLKQNPNWMSDKISQNRNLVNKLYP
jgi:site-specific recombinase XerD